jgi:serine/threonine-protein kinase
MEDDQFQAGDLVAQRYRLDHLLGSGGMGTVWAATHTVTGKAVALKMLRTRHDATARRRVLREARAACAVHHPSVIVIHDVVEAADGSPVLVMDRLEGESLRARLDREGTLPLAEALRVAQTVLEALEVAHAVAIVHRDLKPENLFLLASGELRLLDFGVAKLLASDDAPAAGSGALTSTGAMVGTPFYMAPEQAFGEAIDGRADLWAVGIVLYECLSGELPTRGDNLGQVLRILSKGRIPPLGPRAPGVPGAIAAVVDRLLSIDVAGRVPTARAALDALEYARNEADSSVVAPTEARAPEVAIAEPAASAARRPGRRRVAAIAAAIGLVGAAAAIFHGSQRPPIAGAAAPVAPSPASPLPDLRSIAVAAPSVVAAPPPSARPAATGRTAAIVSPGASARAASVASAAPSVAAASAAPPATKLLTNVPF